MKQYSILLIMVMVFVAGAGKGNCDELNGEDPVFAIQEKIFHKYHELAVVSGYVPGDDFYHVYPVGLSYTYNFNDHFSWEVGRVYYNQNTEKDLRKDLADEFGATPEQFTEPEMQILSHVVFRPFYGKDSVWNKWILNHETYFYAGGGMDFYKQKYAAGSTEESASEQDPCISLGTGIKYFTTEKSYIAFEVRDSVVFRNDETENIVWFGINVGFRFNLRARAPYPNETINRLNSYLGD